MPATPPDEDIVGTSVYTAPVDDDDGWEDGISGVGTEDDNTANVLYDGGPMGDDVMVVGNAIPIEDEGVKTSIRNSPRGTERTFRRVAQFTAGTTRKRPAHYKSKDYEGTETQYALDADTL